MGIVVEFNPDLALRNISEFKNGDRKKEECIPSDLRTGEVYTFLKQGQRNYWLDGEIPLVETKGNQKLSKPIASIMLLESTHLKIDGITYTKGKYKVVEKYDVNDKSIHFNGFSKLA